ACHWLPVRSGSALPGSGATGSAGAASVRVAGCAGALTLPGSEHAPQQDQLTDMIGVVIGDEQRLAKQILSVTPLKRSNEVDVVHRVHESLKCLAIFANLLDALLPRVGARRLRVTGPIVVRPLELAIASVIVATEFEDIALRDAHVLQQLPCRVGHSFGHHTAQFLGYSLHCLVEAGMRLTAIHQGFELNSQLSAQAAYRGCRCTFFRSGHSCPSPAHRSSITTMRGRPQPGGAADSAGIAVQVAANRRLHAAAEAVVAQTCRDASAVQAADARESSTQHDDVGIDDVDDGGEARAMRSSRRSSAASASASPRAAAATISALRSERPATCWKSRSKPGPEIQVSRQPRRPQ